MPQGLISHPAELDTAGRIDAVEKASGSTLPTSLSLSLAQSTTPDEELGRAAALIARQIDLPPSWFFKPYEPQGMGTGALTGGPGLSNYTDPRTGGMMTLATARRLIKPYSADVVQSVLGDMYAGKATGEVNPTADQIASFVQALAPIDGEGITFPDALGAAVVLSRSGMDVKKFSANLAVVATVDSLTEGQKIAVAQAATETGQILKDRFDVIGLLDPQIQEQLSALRTYGPAKDQVAAVQKSDLPQEIKQQRINEIIHQLPGLGSSQEGLLSLGEHIDRATGDYVTEANRIVQQAKIDQTNFHHSFLGHTLSGINTVLNRFTAGVNSGILGATAVIAAGYRGVLKPFGGGSDLGEHWRTDIALTEAAWQGKTTIGTLAVKAAHLPSAVAPMIDLAILWKASPDILLGNYVKGVKEARLLTGDPEQIFKTVSDFLDTPLPRRGNLLVPEELKVAKGETFTQYLQRVARSSADAPTMYNRAVERFTGTFGREGIDPRFSRAVYDTVHAGVQAGLSADAIDQDLRWLTMSTFGTEIPDVARFAHVRDAIRTMNAVNPDAPFLMAERWNTMSDPIAAQIAHRMEAETEAAAVGALPENALDFGVLSHHQFEVPKFSLGHDLAQAMKFAPANDNAVMRSLRAVFNKVPDTVLNLEERPDRWMERWLRDSRVYSEEEIAASKVQVQALANPLVDQREFRLRQLFEQQYRETVGRLAKHYGYDSTTAKEIIAEAVKKARIVDSTTREHLYGLVVNVGEDGIPKMEGLRNPVFETQALNEMVLPRFTDIRAILADELGVARELRNTVYRTLGREIPEGAHVRLPLTKALRRTWQVGNNAFYRFWKPLVVMRPAYILRVPLGEEQLKWLADLGAWDRIKASRWFSRFVPDSERVIKIGVDGPVDVSRSFEATQEADTLYLRAKLPGQSANIPDLGTLRGGREVSETYDQEWKRIASDFTESQDVVPILPGQPNHLEEWAGTLNDHLATSPAGQIALKSVAAGKSERAMMDALEAYAQTDLGKSLLSRIGETDPEAWARKVTGIARSLTTNDPVIANLALAHDDALVNMLRAIPQDSRPTLWGPHVDSMVGKRTLGTKIVDGLSKTIFQIPHEEFSHQPFARSYNQMAMETLVEGAASQGLKLTPEMYTRFEREAADFAKQQVRRVMLDFNTHSRLSELLGFVAPFFNPYEQSIVKWSRLFARNPALIGYIRLIDRAATQSGFVRQDPGTGQWQIPLTWWMGAGPLLQMSNMIPGASLSGSVAGLNMFFSDNFSMPVPGGGTVPIPMPGLAPDFLYAIQKLASPGSTLNNLAGKHILPPTVRDALASWAFRYGPQTPLNVLPSWMDHAISSVLPENPLTDPTGRLNRAATSFLRLQQFMGKRPDPGLARSQAKWLEGMRSFMSLFFVAAPEVRFPQSDLEDEWRGILQKNGGNWDNAFQAFHTKYDGKYDLITIGKTYWGDGFDPVTGQRSPDVQIPATKAAQAIMRQPGWQEFAKTYPEWAWAIIPPADGEGKFDMGVYMDQLAEGLIHAKTPDQFLASADVKLGWEAAIPIIEAWKGEEETMRAQGLSPNDTSWQAAREQDLNAALREVARVYPTWGQLHGPDAAVEDSRTGVDALVMEHARQLVKNRTFMSFEVGKGLDAYLKGRDQIAADMAANNIHRIDSDTSKSLGFYDRYQQLVTDTEAQFPSFKLAYDTFFQKDLLQGVRTVKDATLASLSIDQRTAIHDYDVQRKQLTQQAQQATDPAEKAAAFAELDALDAAQFGKTYNPVLTWWTAQTPAQKAQVQFDVMTKPYDFLTRFERQTVLGEKTTDKSEADWIAYGQASADLRKVLHDNPQLYDTQGARTALFNKLDAYARQLAAQDPVFGTQLSHARQWGYTFEKLSPFVKENDTAGGDWRSFLDAIRSFQTEADRLGLHGIHDGSGPEKALYAQGKLALENYVEQLRAADPQFNREWASIEKQNGLTSLLDTFVPSDYFPVGG